MKRPKLRTPANANRICELLAEGRTLRQVARELGFNVNTSAILNWVRDDAAFRDQYARARDAGLELMAEQILQIADADYTGRDGHADNALVQQARLRVDSRRWLLAKLLPKKYGDRVTTEITGDPDAPLIQRIELIAVDPPRRREDLPAPAAGDDATVTRLRASH